MPLLASSFTGRLFCALSSEEIQTAEKQNVLRTKAKKGKERQKNSRQRIAIWISE
jgi:hypothetical protein